MRSVDVSNNLGAGQSLLDDVQPLLAEANERMRTFTVDAHPSLVLALEHLLESGGKRVRPSVTLLVGQALGADEDRLINLAAAVEMLHTATLVHDDIIDGSLMRRGVSTLNATWSPGATILAGDFIFARAAQLAAATDSVGVMSLFAQCLMTICNGELHQLFEGRAGQRERRAYYDRIYAKTASLFALAGEAAAVLAGAGEAMVAGMRTFGEQLGMAFQIVDDVLDFVGDEASVGKPLGSDLRQGLVTLPTLYFLEEHPDDPRVADVLRGRSRDPERIRVAIEAVRSSPAVRKSLAEARRFADQGQRALATLPASPARDTLSALTDFVVDRQV